MKVALSFCLAIFLGIGRIYPFSLPVFIASLFGLGAIWKLLSNEGIVQKRPWVLFFLFFLMESLKNRWLLCIEYHGFSVVFLWGFLSAIPALSLTWASRKVLANCYAIKDLLLFVPAAVVLIEWLIGKFLCGFSFNQWGLFLAAHPFTMQTAQLWGMYGQSYLILLINLLCYFSLRDFKQNSPLLLSCLFLLGVCNLILWFSPFDTHGEKKIAVVQTALSPFEKMPSATHLDQFVDPIETWDWIIQEMAKQPKNIDLYVFPEVTVPFFSRLPVFPLATILELFEKNFPGNREILKKWERSPLVVDRSRGGQKKGLFVSHAFIAHVLSEITEAELLFGFLRKVEGRYYNSAVLFTPREVNEIFYDKKVLMPFAESIEYKGVKTIFELLGVENFLSKGATPPVLNGKIAIAPSICIEEVHGNFMRKGVRANADLLVNLSNDAWYPNTDLLFRHYLQGKQRGVELGLGVIRSCNTGVSAISDHKGREKMVVHDKKGNYEWVRAIQSASVSIEKKQTLYGSFGDFPILVILTLFFGIGIIRIRACSKTQLLIS